MVLSHPPRREREREREREKREKRAKTQRERDKEKERERGNRKKREKSERERTKKERYRQIDGLRLCLRSPPTDEKGPFQPNTWLCPGGVSFGGTLVKCRHGGADRGSVPLRAL